MHTPQQLCVSTPLLSGRLSGGTGGLMPKTCTLFCLADAHPSGKTKGGGTVYNRRVSFGNQRAFLCLWTNFTVRITGYALVRVTGCTLHITWMLTLIRYLVHQSSSRKPGEPCGRHVGPCSDNPRAPEYRKIFILGDWNFAPDDFPIDLLYKVVRSTGPLAPLPTLLRKG
eukprot:5177779-Amphidinium_carterae.1